MFSKKKNFLPLWVLQPVVRHQLFQFANLDPRLRGGSVLGQHVSRSGLQGDARFAPAMDEQDGGTGGPASPHISLNIVCAMSAQGIILGPMQHLSPVSAALQHCSHALRTGKQQWLFSARSRCGASHGDTLSLFHSRIDTLQDRHRGRKTVLVRQHVITILQHGCSVRLHYRRPKLLIR